MILKCLTLFTDMLSYVLVETVFTVSEVARVLRALEGRFALTPRGIRYYARTGMVEPSERTATGRNARLYRVVDIALLRLVCRLKRLHVHERAIWGLLIYRSDELRARLEEAHGELVLDDPVTLAVGVENQQRQPIRIPLTDFVGAVERRAHAYRTRNPDVWTGTAWIPAAVAATETV